MSFTQAMYMSDSGCTDLARIKLKAKVCPLSKEENKASKEPIIYAITPTFARPEQKAELTRLSQTLMLVPLLQWIIIEDAEEKTDLVSNLLESSGISFTHLVAHTPPQQKLKETDAHWAKPRGVLQRNTALQWLHDNLGPDDLGVVYFADDDNSYSIQLFEELRYTKQVSVWPVGLVGGLMVERPIPDMHGKVTSFNAGYKPNRPFPIDMAGFAINLQLLLSKPNAQFLYEVEPGYQESQLLKQLTTREELEVKADNCTKVYVWHTRTEKPKMREELRRKKEGLYPSHFNIEV
ncbi:hypothetical protein B566_EDAN011985 [Ephemera danica]|nr:hypothetical protein B566_EDAN011985 [Ephemera danica]